MISIKVPATSANFCIGFDCLGVALNLYNEFSFEESDKDIVVNFEEEFNNDSNLVLKSYKEFFKEFNIKYIPQKISLIKEEVPPSRGLGSSATCIVAGVLAANIVSKANKTNQELLSLMTKIEGHPDNVAPAFLGGFVASFMNDGVLTSIKYNVSDKLKFYAFVSDEHLSTELARSVLPLNYSRGDVVFNISRIIHLPKALESGDIDLLRLILKDKIHEPYRIEIINGAKCLIDKINKFGIGIISGSGSTILGISDKEFVVNDDIYKQIKVFISKDGAIIND